MRKCAVKKIEPNPRALPAKSVQETAETQMLQEKIDTFAVPKWSKEGLLEHIIEFIVTDDQVSIF
jgi:hypothetical protein